MTATRPPRLSLPQVTLCAATSVNVKATLRALELSLAQIDFAGCKLFTDVSVRPNHPGISVVPIPRLSSSAAYSDFLLSHMVDHVETSHCLIAQWDGHVLDAKQWRSEFLNYDYIGASWPQFGDGHDVGNGGFSLRTRRLMEACRHPEFRPSHPEDIAIGRTNRPWLERQGMQFASKQLADLFAIERVSECSVSFGYHGVFNMPRFLGNESFWQVYRDLDDRSSIGRDLPDILKHLREGRNYIFRAARMIADRLHDVAVRAR